MNFIDLVFFFYIFVGLYMTSLFIFIYLHSKKDLYYFPDSKPEPVSIIVPCFNEGEHIADAINGLLELEYPKDMIEIIIVDDKSTDNSVEIIREVIKDYKNVKLIVNQRNSGGAAEPTNIGIKEARYDYIAVADADSRPNKDALRKMIGFLQKDPKVGAVTCSVLAKNPQTFMQKIQSIEYKIIAFNRRLLDSIDSVYVTPGPFAVYRKKTLIEVGLFDKKNLTQDIEIVWRLLKNGYKARMCFATEVYSATPKKFTKWWRQRVRWNIGGTQTLIKYRSYVFKKGMLGLFIIPFFSFSLFLGLMGLILFTYLLTRRTLLVYLSTKYSTYVDTALIHFQDISFTPSILNFFGLILFIVGFAFSFFALSIIGMREGKKDSFFNIVFYMLVYLTIYPFIMINGIYKLIRGNYKW